MYIYVYKYIYIYIYIHYKKHFTVWYSIGPYRVNILPCLLVLSWELPLAYSNSASCGTLRLVSLAQTLHSGREMCRTR